MSYRHLIFSISLFFLGCDKNSLVYEEVPEEILFSCVDYSKVTDPNFDSTSIVAQTIEDSGEHTLQVPSTLLPANSIFIRLKTTGDCQITDYQYWATIEDNAIRFVGDTNYVEVIDSSGAL